MNLSNQNFTSTRKSQQEDFDHRNLTRNELDILERKAQRRREIELQEQAEEARNRQKAEALRRQAEKSRERSSERAANPVSDRKRQI